VSRIGYGRVSTVHQDEALQLDAFAEADIDRLFIDKASGTREDRPELQAALDYLREGDTFVVWKLDRLGRSVQHTSAIMNDLRARGVEFVSLTQGIDTSTAGGRMVFHVFAAFAEFERELIVERTHAGLAAARARGRLGGRPTVMTPERLAAAQAMHESGDYKVAEIARSLGVGRATIYRHL
jgi:DNA invertase Pin-like site-specific DNA recombinase